MRHVLAFCKVNAWGASLTGSLEQGFPSGQKLGQSPTSVSFPSCICVSHVDSIIHGSDIVDGSCGATSIMLLKCLYIVLLLHHFNPRHIIQKHYINCLLLDAPCSILTLIFLLIQNLSSIVTTL
jgi:hypothetical protein